MRMDTFYIVVMVITNIPKRSPVTYVAGDFLYPETGDLSVVCNFSAEINELRSLKSPVPQGFSRFWSLWIPCNFFF